LAVAVPPGFVECQVAVPVPAGSAATIWDRFAQDRGVYHLRQRGLVQVGAEKGDRATGRPDPTTD